MGWMQSRRLRYGVGAAGLVFLLLALLRLVFVLGFSGIDISEFVDNPQLRETLGIGLRFDLRLAVLLMLPLALLAWLPRWNLTRVALLRRVARGYWLLVLGVVGLVYIIDFGHYAYLGVRINATVLRYLEDAQISQQMVWETYPVLWIALGWLAVSGLWFYGLLRLERATLAQEPRTIRRTSLVLGGGLGLVVVLLALLGRVENLNLENPVPLRWSDAFSPAMARLR
ncbi:sulfatase, partial [Pseudomonas sp. HMWF006]